MKFLLWLKKVINNFISEPCTYWLNKIGLRDWSTCCGAHDKGYDEAASRILEDQKLRDCVNKIAYPMGHVMYIGVRLFGGRRFKK